MEEFPDLKMSAVAILFKVKWGSDFVVKEALSLFASSFEDDDVGYFYDPDKPDELCTNPGELVGKIANSRLPYDFDFKRALGCLSSMLDCVEHDYEKVGVVVSDCLDEVEAEEVSRLAGVRVFCLGKSACREGMVRLKNASELHDRLTEFRNSLGRAS